MSEALQPTKTEQQVTNVTLLCHPLPQFTGGDINPYLAATQFLLDYPSVGRRGDCYDITMGSSGLNKVMPSYSFRRYSVAAYLRPLPEEQSLEVPGSAELIFDRVTLTRYFQYDSPKYIWESLTGAALLVATAFVIPDFEPQFVPRSTGDVRTPHERLSRMGRSIAEHVFSTLNLKQYFFREVRELNVLAEELLRDSDNQEQ